MTAGAAAPVGRGTLVQRVRVGALAGASWLACRLPERIANSGADLAGGLWYRFAPARAAQARRNLGRVVEELDRRNRGSKLVRRAAHDRRALERLVREAFRHDARYYLEVLRTPALTPRVFEERVVVETPEAVEAAFAVGPMIFVSGHFGPIELPALYLANRSGKTFVAPMETIDDPPLQAWFERTRGSLGVRIVGLRAARRELRAALEAGEYVGIVGDRDIGGGGIEVPLFGVPAPLPIGPALLAIETGAALSVVGVRRLRDGRIAGRLIPVAVAADGSRRERIEATLRAIATAFEDVIADAPEQWTGAFFPIWRDLSAEPSAAPEITADTGSAS